MQRNISSVVLLLTLKVDQLTTQPGVSAFPETCKANTHFQNTLGNHTVFGDMQRFAILKLQGTSPDVHIQDQKKRGCWLPQRTRSHSEVTVGPFSCLVVMRLSHLLNYIISTGWSWLDLRTMFWRKTEGDQGGLNPPVSISHFLVALSLSYTCNLEPKTSIVQMPYLTFLITNCHLSNTKLLKIHKAETFVSSANLAQLREKWISLGELSR